MDGARLCKETQQLNKNIVIINTRKPNTQASSKQVQVCLTKCIPPLAQLRSRGQADRRYHSHDSPQMFFSLVSTIPPKHAA